MIRTETAEKLMIMADETRSHYSAAIKEHEVKPVSEETRTKHIEWFLGRISEMNKVCEKAVSDKNLTPAHRKEIVSMCLTGKNLLLTSKEAYRRLTTFDVQDGEWNLALAKTYYVNLEKGRYLAPERATDNTGRKRNADKTLPNVLFIVMDTVRADHLSCYGYGKKTTPNIDKIASEGVLFETAISQAPHTPPSVATLLTGLYPQHHQLVSHFKWKRDKILIGRFREAGYRTAAFSANHLVAPDNGFDAGFDYFVLRTQATADVLNNEIYLWLEDYGGQAPYFMYVQYMDPHDTYNAPEPFNKMFDPNFKRATNAFWVHDVLTNEIVFESNPDATGWIDKEKALELIRNQKDFPINDRVIDNIAAYYDGELRFVDYHIGDLLEKIEKRRLLENTVVVITSDHGEAFLEHGFMKHGYTLYDEMLHVPLIFWDGGRRLRGRRVGGQVELADVMPTVMKLAGLEIPGGLDGHPLLSADGAGPTPRRSEFAHSSTWYGWSFKKKVSIRKFSLRTDKYKLIYSPFNGLYELYGLETDGSETKNLANAGGEDANRLMEKMNSYVREFKWFDELDKKQVNRKMLKRLKQLGYIK